MGTPDMQQKEMEKLDKKWLASLANNPWESLLAHTQILLGAMASGTMSGAYDVIKMSIRRLQQESGLSGKDNRVRVENAWSIPMRILMKDDYKGVEFRLPQDPEEMTVEAAEICMTQERLTLALIRMQSRILKDWETDVLEDAWTWAAEDIKIHPN